MTNRLLYSSLTVMALLLMTGCFRPIIALTTTPSYPVEVFYPNQRPDRPFEEIQLLEEKSESPADTRDRGKEGRLMGQGNNMEAKDLLLARLTLQAKKLGADALVDIKYSYYTSATVNGYALSGMAVRFRQEAPAN